MKQQQTNSIEQMMNDKQKNTLLLKSRKKGFFRPAERYSTKVDEDEEES